MRVCRSPQLQAILTLKRFSLNTGRVVTITTVMAVSTFPGMSVYCASKLALESFCDVLRVELSRHGAHAAVIRPGDLVKHTRLLDGQKSDAQVS